jgi:hypothetical protein
MPNTNTSGPAAPPDDRRAARRGGRAVTALQRKTDQQRLHSFVLDNATQCGEVGLARPPLHRG